MIDGRTSAAISALPAGSVGTGIEWIVDVYGCPPARLNHVGAARGVCEQVVAELDLKVVAEPHWHRFAEPGGVTGMYLLSESHLTCHTYPEFGFATFNLYCCRRRETWDWETHLAQMLGAARVSVRQVDRGCEILLSEDEGSMTAPLENPSPCPLPQGRGSHDQSLIPRPEQAELLRGGSS